MFSQGLLVEECFNDYNCKKMKCAVLNKSVGSDKAALALTTTNEF